MRHPVRRVLAVSDDLTKRLKRASGKSLESGRVRRVSRAVDGSGP
jgi:hypothetical protein